jgi:serine/threonine protein kinase/Tol biopolymer transport system component
MTPERWREVERLYYAALERDHDDRAAFLRDACGDDEDLRREIESLFVYQAKAKDFIQTPGSKLHLGLLSRVTSLAGPLHQSSESGRFVGRVFGPYQLNALIGAGGMGEVYRAVDTRLNRTVAIKVLPEHVSHDPQRLERFKREAQIVSSLNHPHICGLYDVGIENGINYLVMEHIDGETLQQRLEQGPVPPGRVLEYAIQMCDALDKAHRRGIVHRDLKPANVMLTTSGVKLLDFGVATWDTPVEGTETRRDNSTESLTAEGEILGTLQYLSPEQLEGQRADGRSDLFAFGAVVYEMLTGKRAFHSRSQAALIGAILKDEPQPILELAPQVPPPLAQTVSRCLAKEPDSRWQTANDLLFQLQSISSNSFAVPDRKRPPRRWPPVVERAAWMALVVAAAGATFLATRTEPGVPSDSGADPPAVRFAVRPAAGTAFYSGYDLPFALSPDGRQIAYVATRSEGTTQLWLRSLSSDVEQPMVGTEGAHTPFWSPDSKWIGFFADNSLKKVRVSSGLAQVIAGNVSCCGGATWNADDVIVFPAANGVGLSRVSAQGGSISLVTKNEGEGGHLWPQFLEDGTHFIFGAGTSRSIYVGSLGNERPRLLMTFPLRISSLAHVPGYIFFVQDGALFARAFDEKRLEFSGDAIHVLDGIPVTGPGRAPFSVSAAGVLSYWPYQVGTPAVLRWFERNGRSVPVVDSPAQYVGFSLSPDARQLVFSRTARNGGTDVWLRDLTRGDERQLTFDGAAFTAQWSPDGTRIVFSGPGQSPPPKLFVQALEGTRAPFGVGHSSTANFASGWSGDGQSIVSVRMDSTTGNDLWVQRVQGTGRDERLPINTSFNEVDGKVSPDSRWIAYVTDESGRDEVWIATFPSGTMRHQVSIGGGTSPQWSGSAKELFYIADEKLVVVSFTAGQAGVELGTRQVLFQIGNLAGVDRLVFPTSNAYAVTSNGQRFLVAVSVADRNAPPISVVVNWRALLKH